MHYKNGEKMKNFFKFLTLTVVTVFTAGEIAASSIYLTKSGGSIFGTVGNSDVFLNRGIGGSVYGDIGRTSIYLDRYDY